MKICKTICSLHSRDILTDLQSDDIAKIFSVLSNGSRCKILHALIKHDELSVTNVAAITGMNVQAVSNQLRKMLDNRILKLRRQGTQTFYSVAMSCFVELIEKGICIVEELDESSSQ